MTSLNEATVGEYFLYGVSSVHESTISHFSDLISHFNIENMSPCRSARILLCNKLESREGSDKVFGCLNAPFTITPPE